MSLSLSLVLWLAHIFSTAMLTILLFHFMIKRSIKRYQPYKSCGPISAYKLDRLHLQSEQLQPHLMPRIQCPIYNCTYNSGEKKQALPALVRIVFVIERTANRKLHFTNVE